MILKTPYSVQAQFSLHNGVCQESHESMSAAVSAYTQTVASSGDALVGAAMFDRDGNALMSTGEGPALVYEQPPEVPALKVKGGKNNPAPVVEPDGDD